MIPPSLLLTSLGKNGLSSSDSSFCDVERFCFTWLMMASSWGESAEKKELTNAARADLSAA